MSQNDEAHVTCD